MQFTRRFAIAIKHIRYLVLCLFASAVASSALWTESSESDEALSPAKESKPFIGKYILSFDIKALYYSAEENKAGLGLGVALERQIFPFLSVRADGANNTMWLFTKDMRTDAVTIGVAPLLYPFSRGLDWLYLGCGISTEFITYRGDDIPSDHERDTVIALVPQIGWKQNFFDYVMVDIFCSYNIELSDTNIPEYAEELVDNGFEVGIKFKINLSRILRKIFKKEGR